MSFNLGGNLSPLPVSTSTRWPPLSTSRQRVVYSQRLAASHDTSLDHSVFGTTPCMAPPSRRKLPPFNIVSLASPNVSTLTSVDYCTTPGAAGTDGGAGAVVSAGALGGAGAAVGAGSTGGAATPTGSGAGDVDGSDGAAPAGVAAPFGLW